MAKRLLELARGGTPEIRISRHQAGDFVSADEVIAMAVTALEQDTLSSKGKK